MPTLVCKSVAQMVCKIGLATSTIHGLTLELEYGHTH